MFAAAILVFLPHLTKAVTFIPENDGLFSNGLVWGGYQASVLDITDPSQYERFTQLSNVTNLYADNGDFNASFSNYEFGSIAPKDGNPAMRTWSSVSGVEFDLSFELSAPVLLNGGLGSFQSVSSAVNEWSMPAGKTTGWLSLNDTKVTVNAQMSLTWYDRQWNGAPPSWTWFALLIESGKAGEDVTPMSIWSYNTTSGLGGLATIREAAGVQKVLPVASVQPSNRSYTSEASGVVYPLDWVLELNDGTILHVSSVRPDQELPAAGKVAPAYEGYVTVKGTYKSGRKFKGYGVVEVTASAPA
ncbi:Secreted hydrolase protein [Rutstroemia sp. NJR-2017a WRK4]|nr:Secreted hydrolase protein [Rutstroemia sp. NJR-2017a WRK4]